MARDVKYIATGAHEHGHAVNAQNRRYPRAWHYATSLGDTAGVAGGTLVGALARSRLGTVGGAAVGAGVSALGSAPRLIEEYQATKNALDAMRASGEFSEAEHAKAQKTLRRAYKTYIGRALTNASVAGSVGGGSPGLALGMIGPAGVYEYRRNVKARREFEGVRGRARDRREIDRLAKRMGSRAATATHGGAGYAAAFAPSGEQLGLSPGEYRAFIKDYVRGDVPRGAYKRGLVLLPKTSG